MDEALFGCFAINNTYRYVNSDRLDKRLARVQRVAIDNK